MIQTVHLAVVGFVLQYNGPVRRWWYVCLCVCVGGGGRLMKVFAENTTKIRIWNDNET